MAYEVSDYISKFLPPQVITVRPLDYDWDEATNAVIFTSKQSGDSFAEWQKSLEAHFNHSLMSEYTITARPDSDLECTTFYFNATDWIDLHAALCHRDGFRNLNAWLGSTELENLVKTEEPAMAGVVRIRPT